MLVYRSFDSKKQLSFVPNPVLLCHLYNAFETLFVLPFISLSSFPTLWLQVILSATANGSSCVLTGLDNLDLK